MTYLKLSKINGDKSNCNMPNNDVHTYGTGTLTIRATIDARNVFNIAIDTNKAKKLREDSISFQSLGQLRSFLTPKRLELLRIIKHKRPKSIYELAKLVGRTPENVNSDIKFLEQLGFVEITKVKEVRKKIVPEVSYDKMTLEISV